MVTKPTFRCGAALGLLWLAACADGIEPVPFQGVSGTVRFVGAVPDSTEWVRLAAYRDLPGSALELLSFAAISDTLPLGGDSASYVLGLDAGVYGWLPLIWKPAGLPLSPSTLRVLGWYTGAQPFDRATPFVVTADEETAEIDLVADFNNPLTLEEALEAAR
jgi:hypothetical protein